MGWGWGPPHHRTRSVAWEGRPGWGDWIWCRGGDGRTPDPMEARFWEAAGMGTGVMGA